jgi:hypothetical protein
MKRRTHVLNKALEGFVQRKDASVLIADLNKIGATKQEYIIEVNMSPLQKKLARQIRILQKQAKGCGTLNTLKVGGIQME